MAFSSEARSRHATEKQPSTMASSKAPRPILSTPATTSPCSNRTSPDDTSALDSWRAASTVAGEKSSPTTCRAPRCSASQRVTRPVPQPTSTILRPVTSPRARTSRVRCLSSQSALNVFDGQSDRAIPRRADARESQYEEAP
jgi:hypothetical protein